MINEFYVKIEKLLKLKFRSDEEEEEEYEDYYADELAVRVYENGRYVVYHFAELDDMDLFIFLLEDEDIPYDVIDGDGNIIEFEDDIDDYDDD